MSHEHGPGCGHTAVVHGEHVDYLVDGRLESPQGGQHALDVDPAHPQQCTPAHECHGHDQDHRHGPGCGHEPVPHGDHVDYLVDGHLHHPHNNHCDHHGELEVMQTADAGGS